MNRLFQALRPFIRTVIRHPGWVLVLATLLSLGSTYFARELTVDTDFANLIPSDYPSVEALERLKETVGGESEAIVAIESPSFRANKAFADAFIPRALKLKRSGEGEPYFNRVDYHKDVTFLKDNALYFATPAELIKLQHFLKNEIKKAKLKANPFYFDIDEDEEASDSSKATAEELQAVYSEIVSKEYPISDDSTTMALRFYPTGAQTNIGFIKNAYRDLDSLAQVLNPASFNPQMKVTMAGRLLRQLTEVRAVEDDVKRSFGAGVTSVLLLVLLYFFYKAYRTRAGHTFSAHILLSELARIPVMALLIGLPLLMSLLWTFGAAFLAFGKLNLMTSTLGLILFGLGIDFGIHFYARYTEERGHGHSVDEAVEITFISTGQAITVGALTTSMALYVLMIADFKGFSEFGFIAGTGILFALVAMLVVMPALIVVFERIRFMNLENLDGTGANRFMEGRKFRWARGIVMVSFAAVAAAGMMLPRVTFEYEFGNLEPTYKEYDARKAIVRRVYNNHNRRNPAYIVVDTRGEVEALEVALRRKMAQDTLSPTIGRVESLEDRFPLDTRIQNDKLARIAEIRSLLDDPFIKAESSADMDRLRRAAQTRARIDIDQVPEFMRKRFTSKSGVIGNFVIIYPSVGLSNGKASMAFSDDVGTVTTADGRVYHAGSTSLVAADMLRLMQKEAPWMVLAAFGIVVLLMIINFQSIRWAALATLPLVVGVLWMLLLMETFGLKLNFYNIIVLPAILGIGNDAGVHIVHRFREEGPGSILHVLRSSGEHVTMASLTTMMGFAGLLLSFHPGLRSIGQLAVVGIGATLVAALIFLPALLQWLEDRQEIAHEVPASVGE